MSAPVSLDVLDGFEVLVLQNARVRATVIPQLGGRVWELLDRALGRQWIWHHQDVSLSVSWCGSNYDNTWAGGLEELFPSDAPVDFEGRVLPDYGEWWATAWRLAEAAGGDEPPVRLVADTHVRKASCMKNLDSAKIRTRSAFSYRIEGRELEALHFLFKQHLGSACRHLVSLPFLAVA